MPYGRYQKSEGALETGPGGVAARPEAGPAVVDEGARPDRIGVLKLGGFHPTDGLDGAPLDFVKLVAAILMAADHVNSILLDHAALGLWFLGRPVFPLFCFVLACNLRRGSKISAYAQTLLLFAVGTQPIYGAAFGSDEGNVLMTLALGAITAAALRSRGVVVQHAVFAAGGAAILTPWLRARSGVDFGIAGILFPAALLLCMDGRRSHLIWLVVSLVALNWFPVPYPRETWIAAVCAGFGSVAIVTLARTLKRRPRFLPRYALHLFYPGHLLVLMALRAAI